MSTHKAFQKSSNDHSNGNGHAGSGEPQANDDGKMKKIETENFHLRRQLEDKNTTTNTIKQIMTTLRTELDDIKDKNYHLEMEMIKLRADHGNRRKIKNASRHGLPLLRLLNKKMHEIQEKLQTSDKKLESVKSENVKLKRKVSSERKEFDEIIQRKRRKLEKKCETIIQLKNGLEKEREKCDVQNGKLLSACDKLDTTLDHLEICENKMATQNVIIEELQGKANLLESVLQENQKLQKWCDHVEKFIKKCERANKKDKLEITKLRRRCTRINAKLNEKQNEMDAILEKRNQLFDFVREVCAISRFPEDDNFMVQNQLEKLVAHLKETFKTGTLNNDQLPYQQASHSLSSPSINSVPQHVSDNRNGQHAENVSRRKCSSGQGCDSGAKYFCVCGHIETSKARLKVHVKQFREDLHFKCSKCPNRFLYMGQLKIHLAESHLMDHPLDKFVAGCKFCGKMFETKEEFRQHKISAHINNIKS